MIKHTVIVPLSFGSELCMYLHTSGEGEDTIAFAINSPAHITSIRFGANMEQSMAIYAALGACLALVP
jgi:hypothetical protein